MFNNSRYIIKMVDKKLKILLIIIIEMVSWD